MPNRKTGSDRGHPDGAGDLRPVAASSSSQDQATPSHHERDARVRPLENGRDRDAWAASERGPLTATRASSIRRRIARGYYDDPMVVDRVVRQILASGDLARDGQYRTRQRGDSG
jgi:hypothetical protein